MTDQTSHYDPDFVLNAPMEEVVERFENDQTLGFENHTLKDLIGKKVIVSLSGGMDTSLLAAYLLYRGIDAHFVIHYKENNYLSYEYLNQLRLLQEWKALNKYTKYTPENYSTKNLSFIHEMDLNLLTVKPGVIADNLRYRGIEGTERKGKWSSQFKHQTKMMKNDTPTPFEYWSGLKAIMLGMELSIGAALGVDYCLLGYIIDQLYGYDSQRVENADPGKPFLNKLGGPFPDEEPLGLHSLRESWQKIYYDLKVPQLYNPLFNLTKVDVVTLGTRFKVPFGLTRTCGSMVYYIVEKKHYQKDDYIPSRSVEPVYCGVCKTCKYRLNGFKQAGKTDPIFYDGQWDEDKFEVLNDSVQNIFYGENYYDEVRIMPDLDLFRQA